MKAKEIRELTPQELQERIEAEKKALNTLKINHAISPVENTTVLKKARRNIARMLTVLHQKQH